MAGVAREAFKGKAAGQSGRPDRTEQICGLVAELNRRIEANMRRAVSGLQLTVTQGNALRELETPLSQRELADRLLCEPSNVTFVIDRLERQGLVQRRDHPRDRRIKELVLTESGQRMRLRLLEALTAASPLAHLDERERSELRAVLLRAVERG